MSGIDTNLNLNEILLNGATATSASTAATKANALYEIISDIDGDTINFTNTIKNATSQKDKINSAISGEGLKTKREEVAKNLSAMQKELENIEEKIATATANLQKAQAQLKEAESEIERLTNLKEQEEANLDRLETEYKATNEKHLAIAEKIEKLDESMGGVSKKIENYTSKLEAETKSAQEKAIWEAMNSYDESKDGSWEEFLASKMNEISPDGHLSGLVGELSNQSSSQMREMASLQFDLGKYNTNLSNLETKITSSRSLIEEHVAGINKNLNIKTQAEADIETYSAQKTYYETVQTEYPSKVIQLQAQLSDYDYLISNNFSPISDEEWKFVEDNNINLSEKMSNGKSRYLIAPGIHDKACHIYDMSKDGASIVRQKASAGGFDIIKDGNGYMRDFVEKAVGDGKIVFSLDDCDNLTYHNGCYNTTSPLAFDLEGDGIKTTGMIINFDIDGDGKIDRINDSADAILVFDADGDGISGENGLEVFGDNTDLDGDGKKDGFKDGFEALKALASKEGLIGEKDSELDENDLKVLEEKYGLGIKTNGYNSKTQSLSEIGLSQINLSKTNDTTLIDNFDGQGNQLMTQKGATFILNGKEKEYADIWHRKYENETSTTSASSNQNAQNNQNIFLQPDLIDIPDDLYDLKFSNHSKITTELSATAQNDISSARANVNSSQETIDKLESDVFATKRKMNSVRQGESTSKDETSFEAQTQKQEPLKKKIEKEPEL